MPLVKWFDDIDELLEDRPGRPRRGRGPWTDNWDLAADVHETEKEIIVQINVPGIDPDKISIDLENNHLHIAGSREEERESEDRRFYRKEIRRGSFERVIPLPCSVDVARASAEYKDGVLRIALPKQIGSAGHNIKIKRT